MPKATDCSPLSPWAASPQTQACTSPIATRSCQTYFHSFIFFSGGDARTITLGPMYRLRAFYLSIHTIYPQHVRRHFIPCSRRPTTITAPTDVTLFSSLSISTLQNPQIQKIEINQTTPSILPLNPNTSVISDQLSFYPSPLSLLSLTSLHLLQPPPPLSNLQLIQAASCPASSTKQTSHKRSPPFSSFSFLCISSSQNPPHWRPTLENLQQLHPLIQAASMPRPLHKMNLTISQLSL